MNFVMQYNGKDTDVFKAFPRNNLNRKEDGIDMNHLLNIIDEFLFKPNIRKMIFGKINKEPSDDLYKFFKVQKKQYGLSENLLKQIYAIIATPRLNNQQRHCMPLLSLYLYNDYSNDLIDYKSIADVFSDFIENNQCYIDIYKNASEYKDINSALYLLDQLTYNFQDKYDNYLVRSTN